MLSAATRQEVQGMVEGVKNTLLDRLAPKNYIQALADSLRVSILQNLYQLHAENQMLYRSGQTQRDQIQQRIISLEAEVKTIHQLLGRIAEQQAKVLAMRMR